MNSTELIPCQSLRVDDDSLRFFRRDFMVVFYGPITKVHAPQRQVILTPLTHTVAIWVQL